MKILHIYKSYYPYTTGGIEKYIDTLTESLYASGIESTILTTTQERSVNFKTFNKSGVYYFPAQFEMASCPVSLSLLKNFSRLSANFDIIHYHFPWPFADLTNILNFTKKPVVISYHSDIIRQKSLNFLYKPLMHSFLKKSQTIIASSENYLQSSRILKQYAKKTTVIPFGLDESHYPVPPKEWIDHWRRRVGDNFFLFVGALRYYKGLHFLLEAVQETSIRVVIAGSGSEENKLLRLKTINNLHNVIFVGSITELDKSALHHLCRATIAPSHLRSEAFCISILESLIYCRPCISTELNTGTSFANKHNVSGIVVPPSDPSAIRRAMELLLKDEILYQYLKTGTQSHFQRYFTVNLMRDRHIQLYRKVINRN